MVLSAIVMTEQTKSRKQVGGDYNYGEVWYVEAGGSEAEGKRMGLYSLSVR